MVSQKGTGLIVYKKNITRNQIFCEVNRIFLEMVRKCPNESISHVTEPPGLQSSCQDIPEIYNPRWYIQKRGTVEMP
jgi:hypothetical protein